MAFGAMKGWTAARDLQIGDELRTPDGRWVTLDAKEHQPEPEPVFNLRVADYHTYFVGNPSDAEAVLVHNEYGHRSDVRVVGNIIFYDGSLGLPAWDEISHLIIFRTDPGPRRFSADILDSFIFLPVGPSSATTLEDPPPTAAAKLYEMLKATPPRVAGIPTLTDDDLQKIAEEAAKVYVQVVEVQLRKWPGATPHNGSGWATWKEGLFGIEKTDEEVANDPVCADWCCQMCQEMKRLMSNRKIELSNGSTVNLGTLLGIKWTQWRHGILNFEHNYPVIHPAGSEDADGRPSAYLILDAWASCLPELADSSK